VLATAASGLVTRQVSQTCIFHIFMSSSSDKRVPRKSTMFLILSQYCTWSMLP